MLVLIEGLDLSGKSSVTKRLKTELSFIGLPVECSYGALHKNRLAAYVHDDLCHRETGNSWYVFTTNLYLTMLPIIDWLFFKPPAWESIYLHESYVCRTIAYNRIHKIPMYHHILSWLQPHLVQFDLTLYFTANVEARRKRLEMRRAVNSDDMMAVTNPESVMIMDTYLAQALSRQNNVVTIDNSELSLDQTVEVAKNTVLKYLQRV